MHHPHIFISRSKASSIIFTNEKQWKAELLSITILTETDITLLSEDLKVDEEI